MNDNRQMMINIAREIANKRHNVDNPEQSYEDILVDVLVDLMIEECLSVIDNVELTAREESGRQYVIDEIRDYFGV